MLIKLKLRCCLISAQNKFNYMQYKLSNSQPLIVVVPAVTSRNIVEFELVLTNICTFRLASMSQASLRTDYNMDDSVRSPTQERQMLHNTLLHLHFHSHKSSRHQLLKRDNVL